MVDLTDLGAFSLPPIFGLNHPILTGDFVSSQLAGAPLRLRLRHMCRVSFVPVVFKMPASTGLASRHWQWRALPLAEVKVEGQL